MSENELLLRNQLLLFAATLTLGGLVYGSSGITTQDKMADIAGIGMDNGQQKTVVTLAFPAVSAHAYMIKIMGENQPLAAQREWKPLPPASITKLLTAVVAREIIPEDAIIPLTKGTKTVEEKRTNAPEGEEFPRDDLIRLALVMSANDAATALAEEIGRRGNIAEFPARIVYAAARMNEKAQQIGMTNSHFENPTGLDPFVIEGESTPSWAGNFVTAQDVMRLAAYIMTAHPELLPILRTTQTSVVARSGTSFSMETTNELLNEYPALIGGKTGLTDMAKGTLFLLYPLGEGKVAAIMLLGSEDRFADGRVIIQWLEAAMPR